MPARLVVSLICGKLVVSAQTGGPESQANSNVSLAANRTIKSTRLRPASGCANGHERLRGGIGWCTRLPAPRLKPDDAQQERASQPSGRFRHDIQFEYHRILAGGGARAGKFKGNGGSRGQ